MHEYTSIVDRWTERLNRATGNLPARAKEKSCISELKAKHKERTKLVAEMNQLSEQQATETARYLNPDGLRNRLGAKLVRVDVWPGDVDAKEAICAFLQLEFGGQRHTYLSGLIRAKGEEITLCDKRIGELERDLNAVQSELSS